MPSGTSSVDVDELDARSADPSPKSSGKTSGRYDVASTTGSTPAARARAIWCSVHGTPAAGSIGFGVVTVSGRSRVPWPPTSSTASSTPAIVGSEPCLTPYAALRAALAADPPGRS